MVTTRRMAALTDPTSPPSASFDTVVPHSAATVCLPSPMQREHDKDHETESRRIVNISDITRICLRHRIQKIYDMLTHVVEGYGTFYYNKDDDDDVDNIDLSSEELKQRHIGHFSSSVKIGMVPWRRR